MPAQAMASVLMARGASTVNAPTRTTRVTRVTMRSTAHRGFAPTVFAATHLVLPPVSLA